MSSVDLLEIHHAAEAFGVSKETLLRRLDLGGLPEAVRHDGSWTVPTEALTAIAEREGWPLDLTSGNEEPRPAAVPEQLDRYINETMAAHAAVVLAKTQATAARAEARDLGRQVRLLNDDFEAERAERERASAALLAAEKAQAILERDRAVADARADELRKQVEQDRVERSLLAARIGILEADREEAITSMDWLSRRRYERRQALSKGPSSPKWSPAFSEVATSGRLRRNEFSLGPNRTTRPQK